MQRTVAGIWLALSGWAFLADPVAGLAMAPVGFLGLRMAAQEIVATDEGLVLTFFFRTRRFRWDEVSHFEKKRFGLRDAAVPSVVLTDGRRFPLHGIDSALSGFGGKSPMWEPTLRRLTERLNQTRYGSSGAPTEPE